MNLCVNPDIYEARVKIPGGYVVLHLKQAGKDQTLKFRNHRFEVTMKRNRPEFKNNFDAEILELVDDLLVDVHGLDEEKNPVTLTYKDSSGQMQALTHQVADWKSYIPVNYKIVAGKAVMHEESEVEYQALKKS